MNINEQANFIWSIADLLRGDFKQSEYGKQRRLTHTAWTRFLKK